MSTSRVKIKTKMEQQQKYKFCPPQGPPSLSYEDEQDESEIPKTREGDRRQGLEQVGGLQLEPAA